MFVLNEEMKEELIKKLEQMIMERVDGVESVKVEITDINKINETRTSVIIRENNSTVGPSIYLDSIIGEYDYGIDVDEISERIFKVYSICTPEKNHIEIMCVNKDDIFKGCENRITMQLINTEQNEMYLKDKPHRESNDLSVIYRIVIEKNEMGQSSAVVTDSIAKAMKMTEADLFAAGCNYMRTVDTPVIQPLYELVRGMMGDAVEDISEYDGSFVNDMWILTNQSKLNGAAAILLDENLQKLTEKMDDDIYILPSSIHEVVALKAGSVYDEEYLSDMVAMINSTQVKLSERLSNQVYYYDRNAHSLTKVGEPARSIDCSQYNPYQQGR